MTIFERLFHIHEYDPIDNQGFQRCHHCGKVRFVARPECDHVYYVRDMLQIKDMFVGVRTVYIQECKKCGNINKVEIS